MPPYGCRAALLCRRLDFQTAFVCCLCGFVLGWQFRGSRCRLKGDCLAGQTRSVCLFGNGWERRMLADLLGVVAGLFAASCDFVRYGLRRLKILYRAWKRGGWRNVRRVSLRRKMAVSVWSVFAALLAASSIFGRWLVFCRLGRFLGWHGGKTHGRTVQMGGQDFGGGGGLDTRADVFGIPVCGTKPFFPSDRTYRCAGFELGSVSCRRLWKHGMFGLADVFCRYGRIDRRLVLVRVLVCLFSMGSLCPAVKYNRHTLFLMRQRKIAAV